MIEALVVIYFGVGVILVTFGLARHSIAREVEKVKNLKPSSRSNSKAVDKNKIVLFRLIITAGFVVLWLFFLPGVLKDNHKSATFALVNKTKKSFKSEKFKCPKCNNNEAVQILYGYPLPETLQAWHNKEIELGGCIVGNELTHKCFKCGHQW